MPLDTNLALQFRLPQAEQPFQTLGGMLTLRGELMKQDEAQRQIRDRMAFENEVRALPESERTTENVTKIAAKYVGAKDLYHYGQQSMDTQARIAATREAALARITEAHRINDIRIADAASKTQDRDVRQQLLAAKNANDAWFQRARIASQNINTQYNTGQMPDVGAPPDVSGVLMQLQQRAQATPQGAPQPQGPQPMPDYGAAAGAYALGRPFRAEYAGGEPSGTFQPQFTPGMSPQLQPQGTPQPAPPAPAPMAPQAFPPQPQAPQYWSPTEGQMDVPPSVLQGVPGVRAQAAAQGQGMPPMPPEIAALPPKARQQWLLQQTKPSIAGAGQFSPETLAFTARQYLSGDRQAAQGYSRNATARIALQNAIVDEAQKMGISPQAAAAKMAEFAGTVAGSRTVGQRAANISLAATEAHEMLGIVKETSDRFARTNFVPWNMALRAYESGTGTPEIAEFGAAVNALVNVYARAINPTGVPTVSDKEHARAILNTIQSPAQVDGVLGIIRRELEIAQRAPSSVQEATRQRITGGGPAVGTVMEGYKFKGGNPSDKNNWEKM